jgi:Fe-S-cluster containining protein
MPGGPYPLRVVDLAARREASSAAEVRVSFGGRPHLLRVGYPEGAASVEDFLPVFHGVTDLIVEAAVREAEGQGRAVSCRKGCGACCRQGVPVSVSEGRALARLVEAMPEPRRSEVRARFADAVRRLEAAGLGEMMRAAGRPGGPTGRALGEAYFRAGVPCPLLEEESCSIHADRPAACREFLVTSPAEECARPTEDTVKMVPVPVSVAAAVREMDGGMMPLVLALERASEPEAEPRPGTEVLREFLGRLAGG